MKLMTLKQFERKSKESLIRYITKYLKKKSRKTLASLAYHITKGQLPQLKFSPIPSKKLRKGTISYKMALRDERKRKPKRKFSRKQLAAQRLFAKRARAGTLRRKR